ncbi:RloB family protein [Malikia spinosa]|nr:RloB family protein [Malikia spinosa]
MAAKDIFSHRKPRNAKGERAAPGHRKPAPRYLLVCEGSKTEPFYFRDLLQDFGVPPLQVKIGRNEGLSPDQIVNRALELYEEDRRSGDAFDEVFCIFDRDAHEHFQAAVSRVKDLARQGSPLRTVVSVPCFEFWLLLHFGYTAKPFAAKGKKSVGSVVVSELKTCPGFGKYDKGNLGVYALLRPKLDHALRYASQLQAAQAKDSPFQNPSTQVHELIAKLKVLGR